MLFLNRSFDKKRLKALLLWFRLNLSEGAALKAVEILQELGFRSATQGAISLGLDDLKTPANKGGRVFQAQLEVALAHHEHYRGNRTPVELFQHLVDTWHRTSQDLTTQVVQLFHSTERVNPVYMMAFSGARGNISQVRQLVGMRGLMADPRGQIVGFPILSNFREGLTITEYFVSCYGARKGVVDTAIRTADAGYLTRRLADVSHHVVVRTTNCGTHRSIQLRDIKEEQKTILSLASRLVGRVLAEHIPLSHEKNFTELSYTTRLSEVTEQPLLFSNVIINELNRSSSVDTVNQKEQSQSKISFSLAPRNSEITPSLASKLAAQYAEVSVRSPLSCSLPWGVCQLCYGWGLSEGRRVTLGEAVGIIAAQSIGEPGTQLTLRTFHTGGVFSGELLNEIRAPYNGIITFSQPLQGLLLRTPHGQIAFLTKVFGKMKISAKDSLAYETATCGSSFGTEGSVKQEAKGTASLEVDQVENVSTSTEALASYPKEASKSTVKQEAGGLNLSTSTLGTAGTTNQEFVIQPSTVIFVRQKEQVYQNQLLAEFSSSTLQSANDQIEITQQVLSETAGQVWFKELDYGNRKGPGSGFLGTHFSSQNLGGIWVLAGEPRTNTLALNDRRFLPINQNKLHTTQLDKPQTNSTLALPHREGDKIVKPATFLPALESLPVFDTVLPAVLPSTAPLPTDAKVAKEKQASPAKSRSTLSTSTLGTAGTISPTFCFATFASVGRTANAINKQTPFTFPLYKKKAHLFSGGAFTKNSFQYKKLLLRTSESIELLDNSRNKLLSFAAKKTATNLNFSTNFVHTLSLFSYNNSLLLTKRKGQFTSVITKLLGALNLNYCKLKSSVTIDKWGASKNTNNTISSILHQNLIFEKFTKLIYQGDFLIHFFKKPIPSKLAINVDNSYTFYYKVTNTINKFRVHVNSWNITESPRPPLPVSLAYIFEEGHSKNLLYSGGNVLPLKIFTKLNGNIQSSTTFGNEGLIVPSVEVDRKSKPFALLPLVPKEEPQEASNGSKTGEFPLLAKQPHFAMKEPQESVLAFEVGDKVGSRGIDSFFYGVTVYQSGGRPYRNKNKTKNLSTLSTYTLGTAGTINQQFQKPLFFAGPVNLAKRIYFVKQRTPNKLVKLKIFIKQVKGLAKLTNKIKKRELITSLITLLTKTKIIVTKQKVQNLLAIHPFWQALSLINYPSQIRYIEMKSKNYHSNNKTFPFFDFISSARQPINSISFVDKSDQLTKGSVKQVVVDKSNQRHQNSGLIRGLRNSSACEIGVRGNISLAFDLGIATRENKRSSTSVNQEKKRGRKKKIFPPKYIWLSIFNNHLFFFYEKILSTLPNYPNEARKKYIEKNESGSDQHVVHTVNLPIVPFPYIIKKSCSNLGTCNVLFPFGTKVQLMISNNGSNDEKIVCCIFDKSNAHRQNYVYRKKPLGNIDYNLSRTSYGEFTPPTLRYSNYGKAIQGNLLPLIRESLWDETFCNFTSLNMESRNFVSISTFFTKKEKMSHPPSISRINSFQFRTSLVSHYLRFFLRTQSKRYRRKEGALSNVTPIVDEIKKTINNALRHTLPCELSDLRLPTIRAAAASAVKQEAQGRGALLPASTEVKGLASLLSFCSATFGTEGNKPFALLPAVPKVPKKEPQVGQQGALSAFVEAALRTEGRRAAGWSGEKIGRSKTNTTPTLCYFFDSTFFNNKNNNFVQTASFQMRRGLFLHLFPIQFVTSLPVKTIINTQGRYTPTYIKSTY